MLIPIRTDYRLSRTPWMNYALLGLNVVLFVMGYNAATAAGVLRIERWLLYPDTPRVSQFFTSVFLHGGLMHLIGNMIFLWVFGNAINDRFGHLGYLAFYLAGGVAAGVGYLVMSPHAPVLGASGAIAAVTGAYLVLFARTRITLLVVFIFITAFEVPSLYFLLTQILFELYMSVRVSQGIRGVAVAHWAHSSGYAFGIAVCAGLLAARLLPRDAFDLLGLLRSAHRRQRYRRMVAGGYDPFSTTRARPGARAVRSRPVASETPDAAAAQELRLRREIAAACARHDVAQAADMYLRLVQIADDAVLPRQAQLDVANQLMADQRYPQAADAYERFLKHYTGYEHAPDIFLMLGILYGRYLHQYDRAEQYLQRALERLHDSRKRELARADLQNVRRRRGG
jgi:membrane associated rhomboid family serine protease